MHVEKPIQLDDLAQGAPLAEGGGAGLAAHRDWGGDWVEVGMAVVMVVVEVAVGLPGGVTSINQ